MLQRKQTLFLLLAALCGMLTFLFPVDTFSRGAQVTVFRTYGIFNAQGVPMADGTMKVPLAVLLGALSAMLVVIALLYCNRPRQLRLARMAALLLVAVQAALFITDNSLRAYLGREGRVEHSYGVSFFLPMVMVLLVMLAASGIRKDEELVKGMDRLR